MKPPVQGRKSPHGIKPRKQPTQRRAEKRIADILSAFTRLLNGDVRRITTNSVAKEAGIPVSSLYQYFPNKEAIAFAVYRQWAEEAIRILHEREVEASRSNSWVDFVKDERPEFFSRITSAIIVYQLSPVMDKSPELRKVRRAYLAEMDKIVVRMLRNLGSDWPEKSLASIVSLLFDLYATIFRQMARKTGEEAEETYRNWEIAYSALLQHCIETPFKERRPSLQRSPIMPSPSPAGFP